MQYDADCYLFINRNSMLYINLFPSLVHIVKGDLKQIFVIINSRYAGR